MADTTTTHEVVPARPVVLPQAAYGRRPDGEWVWIVTWGDEDCCAERMGFADSEEQAIREATACARDWMNEAVGS